MPAGTVSGQAVKERLAQIMAPPNDFTLNRHGFDRYGLTLAVVYSEGVYVGTTLVGVGMRGHGFDCRERIGRHGVAGS